MMSSGMFSGEIKVRRKSFESSEKGCGLFEKGREYQAQKCEL